MYAEMCTHVCKYLWLKCLTIVQKFMQRHVQNPLNVSIASTPLNWCSLEMFDNFSQMFSNLCTVPIFRELKCTKKKHCKTLHQISFAQYYNYQDCLLYRNFSNFKHKGICSKVYKWVAFDVQMGAQCYAATLLQCNRVLHCAVLSSPK